MLPRFSLNPSNKSLAPLTADFVENYNCRLPFDRIIWRTSQRDDPMVLDIGSGRGPVVAWLRKRGIKAFGLEIKEEYVESSHSFLGKGVVRLKSESGAPAFESELFDFIISNQVLEHVTEPEAFATEVWRMTRPGGAGLHIFPSLLRPIEPHLYLPFVHWLPEGGLRRGILLSMRSMRMGAKWFSNFSLSDQAKIFDTFLSHETNYQMPSAWLKIFRSIGFDAVVASEQDVTEWLNGDCKNLMMARQKYSISSFLLRNFKQTVILLRKP